MTLIKTLANHFDFLKPTLYKIEKGVAAKGIPPVHELPNRKKLSDFPKVETDSFDHSAWDSVLKAHLVDQNGVLGPITGVHLLNYEGIAQDPNFKMYLEQLKEADVKSLPEPDQLAFWMNAYNALCVSLLVSNAADLKGENGKYSINNLSKPGMPVWGKEAGIIGGKAYSLNEIEHTELRTAWAEPAVHGCIVCASASCPNLRPEAFVATRVGEQMDDQMRKWMVNDTKGLVLKGKKLFISRIFLWFGDDFGGLDGLREYLPQFMEDGPLKDALVKHAAIRFFDYSWEMNRKA